MALASLSASGNTKLVSVALWCPSGELAFNSWALSDSYWSEQKIQKKTTVFGHRTPMQRNWLPPPKNDTLLLFFRSFMSFEDKFFIVVTWFGKNNTIVSSLIHFLCQNKLEREWFLWLTGVQPLDDQRGRSLAESVKEVRGATLSASVAQLFCNCTECFGCFGEGFHIIQVCPSSLSSLNMSVIVFGNLHQDFTSAAKLRLSSRFYSHL